MRQGKRDLTMAQRAKIITLYRLGVSREAIAERFGCNKYLPAKLALADEREGQNSSALVHPCAENITGSIPTLDVIIRPKTLSQLGLIGREGR
jgi:hypothetical protein